MIGQSTRKRSSVSYSESERELRTRIIKQDRMHTRVWERERDKQWAIHRWNLLRHTIMIIQKKHDIGGLVLKSY